MLGRAVLIVIVMPGFVMVFGMGPWLARMSAMMLAGVIVLMAVVEVRLFAMAGFFLIG